MKKNVFLGLLVFVLVIGFFGCGGDDNVKYTCTPCKDAGCVKCDPNVVGNREITRNLFGETHSVTVKGVFNKADLNDAADKIAGRINNAYNNDIILWGEGATNDFYHPIFARGVIYIVEAEPVGFVRYKTIGDGKTIYISLDRVDTAVVNDGVSRINNNQTVIDGVAV